VNTSTAPVTGNQIYQHFAPKGWYSTDANALTAYSCLSSYTGATTATVSTSLNAFVAPNEPNACPAKTSADVATALCVRAALSVPSTNAETF